LSAPEHSPSGTEDAALFARRNGLADATEDDVSLLAAMRERVAAQVATIRRDHAEGDEPAHVFRIEPSARRRERG
jgi:hypothetical protein